MIPRKINPVLRVYDYPLLLLLLLCSAMSLGILYSASDLSTSLIIKQLARLGIGFMALTAIALIPLRLWRAWTPFFFIVGIGLLLLVWFAGDTSKGASRWLDLGFVRFQPSELMKLALPMMMAWVIGQRVQPIGWRSFIIGMILTLATAALIARQPDLGTAILIAASGCFVLFLAGLRWNIILTTGSIALAALPLLWYTAHEYQRNRIRTFLNPESDPLGTGWNIIQSKIAIGSGGLFGKGFHQGTQSHLDFLPERSTDFILAVLAEEFGLVGITLLILLYLAIVARSFYISLGAATTYGRLLGGSISMTFCIYVIVNMGMVSGLLPVVGVPLPLISYGGTSIVTLLAGFGLLMAINRDRGFLHK